MVPWNPKEIVYVGEALETSTGPVLAETDAGKAVIKTLGNNEGPHALVREWVGTKAAQLLGLCTFDMAILIIPKGVKIQIGKGKIAESGPAIAFRFENGVEWNGDKSLLNRAVNKLDFARIMLLDTWVLNYDRCPPPGNKTWQPNYQNVFLKKDDSDGTRLSVITMDHSHAFNGLTIGERLTRIDMVKNQDIIGQFPQAKRFYSNSDFALGCKRVQSISESEVDEMVREVPREWEFGERECEFMKNFLLDRARVVGDPLYWSGVFKPIAGRLPI